MLESLRLWLAGSLAWLISLNLSPGQGNATRQFPDPSLVGLVADSYRQVSGPGDARSFFAWLESAYVRFRQAPEPETLGAQLAQFRQQIQSASDSTTRLQAERRAAAWMHRFIKASLPTFSLQRGFEFRNAAERGERQCLLQSILISSMLESCGVPAGLAMVYRNDTGSESNNGHVTTVMHGADGRDLLVDASHPHPFAHHRGLMLDSAQGLVFVEPIYRGDEIAGYRHEGRAQVAAGVLPLNSSFALSQVYFYRGERNPNGLMEGKPEPEGLRRSARYFERSCALSPTNPLPLYSLGRVWEKLGERQRAHQCFVRAAQLYDREGWKPASVGQAVARTD